MGRVERWTSYLVALLLFGGLASIGAAAGARYAIGVLVEAGCAAVATGTVPPCQLAIVQLNFAVKVFLFGGAVAVFSGLVASRVDVDDVDDQEGAGQDA